MQNSIIVFVGPSGSGKTSLCEHLINRHGFIRPITCTTRAQRTKERDDAYLFLTQDQFQQKIIANEMLEYVEQFGNYYGSPKASFAVEMDMVVALSESGAQKIKSIYPSRTTTILLKACRSTLISRIYDRAPIAFQELQWRLKDSLNPLSGGFDYTIDANQPFEQVCFLVDKILADLRSVKFKMVTP